MNPSVKLVLLTVVTLVVTLGARPALPGVLVLGGFALLPPLAGITYRRTLAATTPALLIATGFFIFTAVTRGMAGPGFGLTPKDIEVAAGLGLRILAFALYSAVFVLSTEPDDLLLSLVQQFRVPAMPAFSAMVAYRFLPTFRLELEQMRLAHQVRGVEEGGLLRPLKDLLRFAVPILATAVRRGERVAMAMQARGFGGKRQRTYRREIRVTRHDVVVAAVSLAVLALTVYILVQAGLYSVGLGIETR
jgi:energy-coupling factor transport system permease protein